MGSRPEHFARRAPLICQIPIRRRAVGTNWLLVQLTNEQRPGSRPHHKARVGREDCGPPLARESIGHSPPANLRARDGPVLPPASLRPVRTARPTRRRGPISLHHHAFCSPTTSNSWRHRFWTPASRYAQHRARRTPTGRRWRTEGPGVAGGAGPGGLSRAPEGGSRSVYHRPFRATPPALSRCSSSSPCCSSPNCCCWWRRGFAVTGRPDRHAANFAGLLLVGRPELGRLLFLRWHRTGGGAFQGKPACACIAIGRGARHGGADALRNGARRPRLPGHSLRRGLRARKS